MQQNLELLKKSKANFIGLGRAKNYLRINHNNEDEVIEDMLEVAVVAAENYLGIKLIESTWKLTIYGDLPSKIRFFHSPIGKIESFKLYRNNDEISYLTKNHYTLDFNNESLYLNRSFYVQKSEIIYTSGYGNDSLPAPIKQGILEHLSKMYDLRGCDQTLPLSAKSLYNPYKKMRF